MQGASTLRVLRVFVVNFSRSRTPEAMIKAGDGGLRSDHAIG
jgi:hypothetical protein